MVTGLFLLAYWESVLPPQPMGRELQTSMKAQLRLQFEPKSYKSTQGIHSTLMFLGSHTQTSTDE